MRKSIVALASCALMAACASKADDIGASYVPPSTYSNYTCDELAQQAQIISAQAAEAAGVQNKKATNDAVATGVAVVVFWPALFFIKGDGATQQRLSSLKGHMEAIETTSIQKKCGIQFQKS